MPHKSWNQKMKNHEYKTTLNVTLIPLVLMMLTIKFYLSNSFIPTKFFCCVSNRNNLSMNAIIMFYITLFAYFSKKRFHWKYYKNNYYLNN